MSSAQRVLYQAIVEGRRSSEAPNPRRVGPNGSLRGPFNAMLYSPILGMELQELGASIRFDSILSDRVREMAILTVAVNRRCAYEWNSHEQLARDGGVQEGEIELLRTAAVSEIVDPRERAALDLVTHLLGECRGTMSDAEYQRYEEQLTIEEIVEIVVLVGYYDMLATLLALFGVES